MKSVKLSFTFKEKDFCLCSTVVGTTKRHYKKVEGLTNPNFDYWDKKQQRFNEATQDAIHNNAVLQTMYTKYQGLIDTFNPSTGKELFALSETASKVEAKRELTFGGYVALHIDKLKNHPVNLPSGNYRVYKSLLHKLEKEGNVINVPLSEIANKHFIQFGEFVLSTPNAKGQTNYTKVMKNFKAVHNVAKDHELNNNELLYKYSKYAPKSFKKRKSALTKKQYQKFVNLDLSKIAQGEVKPEYYKELYRDFCIFMYEMKSRPVDCVRLNYSNVCNVNKKRCIEYIPEKKKNTQSIPTVNPVTSIAKAIMDKYKGQSSKGYVFPFAVNEMDWKYEENESWEQWNNQKDDVLQAINRFLKKIAVELGFDTETFTIYTFRHTAFTHAAESGESMLIVAKRGGTSITMVGENYLDCKSII
jgi:integrase